MAILGVSTLVFGEQNDHLLVELPHPVVSFTSRFWSPQTFIPEVDDALIDLMITALVETKPKPVVVLGGNPRGKPSLICKS